MELLREAGMFGTASVLLFIVGCAVIVKRRAAAPLSSATPFVLALLACGAVGHGVGQRIVRDALDNVHGDVHTKLTLLNAGTGEAAANLVIGGSCALVLLALAGALSLARRDA